MLVAALQVQISQNWQQPTPILGDPILYGDLAHSILDGARPYLDLPFEHLPAMLAPILAVEIISRIVGSPFTGLWPLVTITTMVGIVGLARPILIDKNYQGRLATAALPMFPLIIYRLEAFVVLAAILAIRSFQHSRVRWGTFWIFIGVLAKGWPIGMFLIPDRLGRRRLAVLLLVCSIGTLAFIASLPGFLEGRSFAGLHTETVVGDITLFFRQLLGKPLNLIAAAGATYISVPTAAVIGNATLGIPVIVLGMVQALRSNELRGILRDTGLVVAGLIIASPLLSPQFLFWLLPFVVLLKRPSLTVYMTTGALSTAIVLFWNPGAIWWTSLVFVRNLSFLALIILWLWESLRSTDPEFSAEADQAELGFNA